jgi:RHS repeat-associated protein
MRTFSFFSLFLALALSAPAQEGWKYFTHQAVPIDQLGRTAPQAQAFVTASADSLNGNLDVADQITPEIQALARALGNDPVRIFEWVRNTIDFVPYNGLKRGAHLTYLERSGNDFDTCALLVALLQASGVSRSSLSYHFANVWITNERSDHNDATTWLGADKTQIANLLASSGAGYPSPYQVTYYSDFSAVRVPHVWVVAVIGSTTYKLDPSFKRYRNSTPVNLASTISYNKADVLTSAGGTSTSTSVQMNQANLNALRTKLTTYTTSLVNYAKNTAHDKSGADLVGQRGIETEILTGLPTSLPAAFIKFEDEVAGGWSQIPETYGVTFSLTIGGITHTFYTAELQGQKLAVWYTGNLGQLWLDDTALEAEPSGTDTSQPASVSLSFAFPDPQLNITKTAADLDRTGRYVIAYGFERTLGRLQQRLQKQAEYVAAGESPTERKLMTENLYLISLQFLNQRELFDTVLGNLAGYTNFTGCFAGIVGQRNAPFVDLPLAFQMVGSRTSTGPTFNQFFQAISYWSSAMEHVTLEQTVPDAAVSTVRFIELAVRQNMTLYLAHNRAEYDAFKPSLLHYTGTGAKLSASEVSFIENTLSSYNGKLLIPQDQAITSGQYVGTGYMVVGYPSNSSFIKMGISGGMSGGYNTQPNDLTQPALNNVVSTSPVFVSNQPPSQGQVNNVGEPIDSSNGAFYTEHTDLALGGETPHGLALERHYTTTRRLYDPAALGKGWTHNYNVQLNTRSTSDIDLNRTSAAEVAPLMLAARVVLDMTSGSDTPAEWVVPALTICWAGEQMVNSRASITMGSRNVEFVKLPDGSFAPPAGINATLTKASDGSYTLQMRRGNKIVFRASDGKFTSIVDNNNSGSTEYALSATYVSDGKLDKVTDSFGRYLQFGYSGARLSSVTDSTGRSVSYGQDVSGNFTFTDAENKTSTYIVDSRNRITGLKDGRNRTTITTVYDAWDRAIEQRTFADNTRLWQYGFAPGVTLEVDPLGKKVRTYFDTRGRRVTVVDQLNNRTDWGYDGNDRVIYTLAPNGDTSSCTYNAQHEVISVTNPAGNTRTIVPESEDSSSSPRTEYNFEGQSVVTSFYSYHKVKDVTAPGGITTNYTYDGRGRIATVHPASYAAGQVISYTYDDSLGYTRSVKTTYPDGTVEKAYYNARGELISSIDRLGKWSDFTYNLRGQRTSSVQWTGTYANANPLVEGTPTIITQIAYDDAGNPDYALDPLGNKTDFNYDALDHLVEVKGPDGVIQSTTDYDVRNLPSFTLDAFGSAVTYTHDDAQRLTQTTDPLNRSVQFGYDANNRRTTVTSALNHTTTDVYENGFKKTTTDALSQAIGYTYDKDGRLLTLKNRRLNSYSWVYDDTNRKVTSKTPLLKTTVVERNARGLTTKVTEPSLQTTTFQSFDAEGRVTQQQDGDGVTTTLNYYANGLLKDVTEGGRTTHRAYDDFGRLSFYEDGEGNTLGYEYDLAGNLTKLTYPGNLAVLYSYDAYNRLQTVTDWANRTTTYLYDLAGRVTEVVRPNGTRRKLVYDAASQLKQIEEKAQNGQMIWFHALKYDNDGRINWTFTQPTPADFTLPADTATYDADNRLASWNGNAVTHDDDGNMTSGPLATDGTIGSYTYDARNRLTACAGQTYRYSPDGHRVQVGSTTYVVDPLSRVLVRNNGGTLTRYVWGLGLIYEDTNGDTRTYHSNHQGSTVALTDGSGNVTDRVEYAPYGTVTSRTGNTNTPFLFNGSLGVMTDSNGLYYLRNRYYNPRVMRFINADPSGFGGGTNLFSYCNGDPVNLTDPFGLCANGTSTGSLILGTLGEMGNQFAQSALNTLGVANEMVFQPAGQILNGARNIAVEAGESLGNATGILPSGGGVFGGAVFDTALIAAPELLGAGGTAALAETNALRGPVVFRAVPGATAEEIAQTQAYVNGSNEALDAGFLSPTGRVSTKGAMRTDASLAAAEERAAAEAAGDPYVGHAGHVPDTTWTGNPVPYRWLDLSPRVNSSLGGQAARYPVGYQPTIFIFKP